MRVLSILAFLFLPSSIFASELQARGSDAEPAIFNALLKCPASAITMSGSKSLILSS